MQPRSIYQEFHRVVAQEPNGVGYRHKSGDRWVDVTWAEQGAAVDRVSGSLIALGVGKGDKVGILSGTRLEWIRTDLGVVNAGAVTVGIYHSNLAPACADIIRHSDAVALFVEDQAQLDKVLSVRNGLNLKHIVCFEGPAEATDGVMSWDEFLDRGKHVAENLLHEIGESLVREDLASLVYTSGTTGTPKAAMITHGNLLFATWCAGQSMDLEEDFVTLQFLPLAHVYARLMIYVCLRRGVVSAIAEDITKVAANLREVRPHFIAGVPRIYEKICKAVTSKMEDQGGHTLRLFHWALGVGRRVREFRRNRERLTPRLWLAHAVADRLVLRKVRETFGGRLVWAISGAAPLNPEVAKFFDACGVLILEGLGMTENSSFTNVNRPALNKFGTVGPAGPGVEMRIADDGEVLFRGGNVMAGYYKDPQATAETIDEDGWLHTGDIGEIDEDGFLRITDRKKDLIITSGGKNVAPQRIERILRESRYIGQVVAYGDRRKFLTALITLDLEHVRDWAARRGLAATDDEELARDPEVERLIQAEVDERNRHLASFETVKRFRILPRDLSIEAGELTPTLKVKRKVIVDRYRSLVDSMYRA